jgi:hypothetical protein
MKILILSSFVALLFAGYCGKKIKAETAPVAPVVEAVPVPTLESKSPTKAEKPDVDLIKTEKTIVDKSCKMVNGKLKCAKKKKIIKKTI